MFPILAIGSLALLVAPAQRERLNVPYSTARQVFERLVEAQTAQKDEYETTDQFETRKLKIVRSVVPGERLFLLVETAPRYDADTGVLTLYTGLNPPSEQDTLGYPPSVVVASRMEDKGTYVGQNEFGARAAIARHMMRLYKLECTNKRPEVSAIYDSEAGVIEVGIPMAASVAQQIGSRLKLLFECIVPQPPEVYAAVVATQEWTVETPYETSRFEVSLTAHLKKVIAFDVQTREVYAVKSLPRPPK